MDTERYRNYLALGWALASEAGGRLLFLTVFGSVLYGTDIPERSDEDVRGIYLPAPCTDPLHAPGLHYSSAAQGTRSTAGDTDCDLLPLDRWLLSDLPRGDTGALDLLYAPSRPSCLLFVEPALRPVFKTPRIFLNLCSGEACRDYAFRQGSRYGLAGTRTGALYRVWKALDSGAFPLKAPLRGYAGKLAELAESPLHCTLLEDGGLRLAGSVDEGCVSGCSGTGCGAGCRDIYPVSRRQWRAKTWTGRPFRMPYAPYVSRKNSWRRGALCFLSGTGLRF